MREKLVELIRQVVIPYWAEQIADHLITNDVVPVVRCKECKHFDMREMECKNDAVSTDNEGGASYTLNFYLDDFCSYGERRSDEG